jgi:hypothetical protein
MHQLCTSDAEFDFYTELCTAALCAAVEVQKMLLAEEQAAHQQHKASSSSNSSSLHEALLQLHDSAMHQQALLQHAECVLAPAVAAMRALSLQADVQEQQLQADNKRLQVRLVIACRSTAQ